MLTTRLTRTASFRLVVLSASLFAIGALLLGGVIYLGVSARMEQQLRDHIVAETSQLLGDYQDNGLAELRHDISERLERAPSPRLLFTVTNSEGQRVFDRIELPVAPGWSRSGQSADADLILLTTLLDDGYRLGVAARTTAISEFARALRDTTLLAAGSVLVIGITMGLLLSRRFLMRVGRLRRAAEAVSRGEFGARVPLSGTGDDFEQLALEINRMLDRIEQLMSELRLVSINIAHDLRTPLHRVRHKLEALKSMQSDPHADRICGEALEALEQTLQTFSALLRIAELESGRAPVHSRPVNLATLLADLHESYAVVAEQRGQSLLLEVPSRLEAAVDVALFNQLLVNLIENAMHHNGAGVRIWLRAEATASGVRIEVIDDGRGIPAKDLQDALLPFFRVERPQMGAGNGLGLCLAARICERLGGSLSLHEASPGLLARINLPRPTEDVHVNRDR